MRTARGEFVPTQLTAYLILSFCIHARVREGGGGTAGGVRLGDGGSGGGGLE